uniref:Uncharacterized protein n=1 Tax=Echeneis naucrates TaxID=173247 RepID=A0A665USX3_ECHNA
MVALTNSLSWLFDVFERAMREVREGKSVRAAAKQAKIDRMTLRRYIDKKQKVPLKKNRFADQLHGLTSLKCRELREPVPDSWSRQERLCCCRPRWLGEGLSFSLSLSLSLSLPLSLFLSPSLLACADKNHPS